MAGINRISLGVQSYNNQELQALGRNHNRDSAIQATQALTGINSTIDLIYGIEKQTFESFVESLEKVIQSDVNHLSLYQLTIEPNTIFYKKELMLPNEDEIEKIELIANELLEKNGYQQYEVSSWAKPGHESQHNMNYWQFGDFLGVGPGSHSKISNEREIVRYRKIKPLEGYIQNQRSTDLKTISDNDLDMDLAMNLLRIKNGLQQQDITTKLPASFLKKYQRGIDKGLLLKDRIGATQKGYRFLNETIQLFF
jgi:oxygen-independent coproporphyrinogen-3 oxidase